ncbi:MAG: penicillin acylase family protein, partial [Pseudomonadota bacterium]
MTLRLPAARFTPASGCAVAIGLAILAPGCAVEPQPGPGERTVRIVRDGYGVAHVYADDRYGLYFGYGHAIAQDRLAQMEMARRSTQGRVAEVLGGAYVEFDRNTRTLFSPASIRRQLDALAPDERAVFDGYAAGINRRLAAMRANPDELMPAQFDEWGFEPGDWSAYDVAMIFVGTMNNRYGDFNTERENAAILAELTRLHGAAPGKALFDLLNPRFTDNAPTTIPKADWSRPAYDSLKSRSSVHGLAAAGPQPVAPERPGGFSNVWLIGKSKARDADAILLNGPQFGWFNPAYVYSIGLHGAGIDVAGNTPFGYPVIMFGHNRRIGWGSTWGASDIVDLFVLELDPDDHGRYRYRGDTLAFEKRTETIGVRGGEPVTFVARRSIHGP